MRILQDTHFIFYDGRRRITVLASYVFAALKSCATIFEIATRIFSRIKISGMSFLNRAQSNREGIRIHDPDKWQDSIDKHLSIYKNDSIDKNCGTKHDTLQKPFRRIEKDSSMRKNKTTRDTIR